MEIQVILVITEIAITTIVIMIMKMLMDVDDVHAEVAAGDKTIAAILMTTRMTAATATVLAPRLMPIPPPMAMPMMMTMMLLGDQNYDSDDYE